MIYLLAFFSFTVWSQTFICDRTDLLTNKEVESAFSEIDVDAKAAHVYVLKGKERVLQTSMKFKEKGELSTKVVPFSLAQILMKLTPEKAGSFYESKTDRGSEHFIVAGKTAFHGYKIDRENPAIKQVLAKGAKLEDHFFKCVLK